MQPALQRTPLGNSEMLVMSELIVSYSIKNRILSSSKPLICTGNISVEKVDKSFYITITPHFYSKVDQWLPPEPCLIKFLTSEIIHDGSISSRPPNYDANIKWQSGIGRGMRENRAVELAEYFLFRVLGKMPVLGRNAFITFRTFCAQSLRESPEEKAERQKAEKQAISKKVDRPKATARKISSNEGPAGPKSAAKIQVPKCICSESSYTYPKLI